MALVFFCLNMAAHAEIVVIAHESSPLDSLNKSQVADIYLGRTTHLPGIGPVIPLDTSNDPNLRDDFYRRVTGKNSAQIKAHWARMYFTGRGSQPKEVEGPRELKSLITTHKNMIGYMPKIEADSDLKVLYAQP